MLTDRLDVRPEVAAALADGRPVVALESTLISHGLPYPQNIEVATASEAAVRAGGAVPATVAIHRGRLLVGLAADDLDALGPQGGTPESRGRDRRRRLGGDDGLGDDDRRAGGRHPGVRDRRYRRG